MAKWMAPGDSARREGLVRGPQSLLAVAGHTKGGVTPPAVGFSIPKFRDVPACRATTRSCMTKWMERGDSARREGPVRYPLSLADCSGAYSWWGTPLLHDSEMRKWGMFLLVEPQPRALWPNRLQEEIQRIK